MQSLFFPSPFFRQETENNEADVFESEKDFLIELMVPGFTKDDFSISASENLLQIKAEKELQEPEGYSVLHKGQRVQKIEKNFRFRQSIIAENIEAVVRDGVLRLTLPKKSSQQLVQIKAS